MAKEDYNCAHRLRVRWAEVEYLGAAHYDDDLAVHCRVAKLGRSSMTFLFEIWRERPAPSASPLITGELVYVNADPKTMKAAPLPEDVRVRVRSYERTAPTET